MKPSAAAPLVRFTALVVLFGLLFSPTLLRLVTFALGSDLYSYVLLIPFVCGYLLAIDRKGLPQKADPSWGPAIIGLLGALALSLGPVRHFWSAPASSEDAQDLLAASTASFVLCIWASGFLSLGWQGARKAAFPLLFLATFIPMPAQLELAVETFLQHWSAEAADLLFSISGMTLFRDGLVFHLPGISLQVAPECSGIHSSLVLLITSMVAGHLFLKSPWKRTVLTVAVLPLAILRNGFRVWTLGELCVHVDREIINSPLHHRGGPIFFALSLIPFAALLYWLWKSEQKKQANSPKG